MLNFTDRLVGLFFCALALLLVFVIVPSQTEVVDSGWMRPQTVPILMATIIGLCGLALVVMPGNALTPPAATDWPAFGRAGAYLLGLLASLWLIGRVGFAWASPAIALAIMLSMGERRTLWLFLGAAAMPMLIWLAIVGLLDRPLP
ncbi:MAG: tripartite tricarboxylate transporter TctB family protein [Burkholderiaceae bacterium]